jgi:peroxiredoxin
MAEVTPEAKTQALTVPRFRKDDPPRHALIAANGDVLRGEIEAITESHFGFRSGLENLKVPRDRVKAAVWLRKPLGEEEAKAGEADRSPNLPQLSRPTSRRVTYSNAQLSTLINALKPDAEDVQFVLPEKRENRSFRFQFGSQTVGEALEQICGLFGLRYRIEPGNKVVLEVPPPPGKGLVFRAYWVNAKSVPVAESTKKLLEEQGLVFPEGGAATFDRGAALITMTNTEAAHGKLSGLLKEKWGGVLGSPTHWLLLANGGRVGLTVEKFEQDFVRGRHPVYGACEVPRREIYTVCTTPPKESYAMKTLMDWQLVEAPEPVIADGAGNASPLVGKEAGQFKLDMVGGGNFDLSQERGKVVVLDFWATWCGPCIKALPGLMETMAAFPKDKVRLVGINQGEPADRVKRFLEVRRWDLPVALDLSQTVGRQYEVSGIPHTVVIGPDGKVAMVKTGFDPENDREIAALVTRLLASPQPGG